MPAVYNFSCFTQFLGPKMSFRIMLVSEDGGRKDSHFFWDSYTSVEIASCKWTLLCLLPWVVRKGDNSNKTGLGWNQIFSRFLLGVASCFCV